MKKIITLITCLIIGTLSLSAQDVSKEASFTANSGDIKLTTFIGKPEWAPLTEANNIFATSYIQMMGAVNESAMVYPIRNYTYHLMPCQPIFPGFESTEGWMNEDVETASTSGLGNNAAPPRHGCQCKVPGYGCQTTACAQSCSIYCRKVVKMVMVIK